MAAPIKSRQTWLKPSLFEHRSWPPLTAAPSFHPPAPHAGSAMLAAARGDEETKDAKMKDKTQKQDQTLGKHSIRSKTMDELKETDTTRQGTTAEGLSENHSGAAPQALDVVQSREFT